jgi:DNA ligase D-like protein (predicted 3'-phosphoesterase)
MSEYSSKRNFNKTPEPKNDSGRKLSQVFLVQEHDASHHNFDFRIEIDGKLKSWAIPKGPSMKPNSKRLAILTEDHPLTYYNFEGKIPEGEYGAGKVLIWDRGHYENERDSKMITAYKQGKIEITLKGKKLKGKFVLIRTKRKSQRGNKNDWLLIKIKDKYADGRTNIVKSETKSVVSHKTISEI